jgi:hypothetical protein
LEPGVTRAWSGRDIIAHVTTWEEEVLRHLPAFFKGRRPPRYAVTHGGIDSFNAMMTNQKAGLSLVEVYRQQEEIHQRIIDAVVSVPAAELAHETRWRRRMRLDTDGH